MSRRLRSNRSDGAQAASTLFGTTCASAASMTSRGWSVSSAAQSRNAERIPCATAAIRRYWSILGSVDRGYRLPASRGEHERIAAAMISSPSTCL